MIKNTPLSPIELINPNARPFFNSVDRTTLINNQFEDSTNQLWLCESEQTPARVLKVCSWAGVMDSDFWVGMQSLFGLNYPQVMGAYGAVYSRLDGLTGIPIPKLLACESATLDFSGFLYCSKLPGITVSEVHNNMVVQLANHIAQLHQATHSQFGTLFNPQYSANIWWPKVIDTIQLLAQKQNVSVDQTLLQTEQACPDSFVPIMPDLRWDQFLSDSKKLTGLVDLDAFVFGAVELEFVILEYLLTEEQSAMFKSIYQAYQAIPDLTACREIYRVLLFFMNVLGEKSLDAWMQAPKRF